MIESVLVANRGEIAVRIFRTCKRLGMRTIAIYSDVDGGGLHVAEADEAHRVGGGPAAESYLDQAAILEVAARAHADAIHPGYGFLAENADFAQACIDAGSIWVGPPPSAMMALGNKAHAKALAAEHDVPLLAGEFGSDQTPDRLAESARRIGFPVLIKASAGGGGRGMRVVERADEFLSALQAAKREAMASFGDDHVIVERFLRRPRHVEIQIFGDQHGHLVHLGERECSIQRRHQKLIEETPSPAVDADVRSRMTAAALRLGRAAGYANAGTVEFLLEDDGRFAFLEVNARLQVEHPVTEAVTGLDLVELQLRVADGEPLPFGQADVAFEGHAVEARVIAEDPLAGFLPSSGTLERFWCPPTVRCDTWVQDGTTVSPYYDSLLAKVVAWAPTRAEALNELRGALAAMQVDGVRHNVDLLLAVVEHPAFVDGALSTAFLDEHAVVDDLRVLPPPVLAAVSALDFLAPPSDPDPWRARSGWRLARVAQPAVWTRAGQTHTATVSADFGGDGVHVQVSPETVGLIEQVRHSGSGEESPPRLGAHASHVSPEPPGGAQQVRPSSGDEAAPRDGTLGVRLMADAAAGVRRLSVEGRRVTLREHGPDRRIVEFGAQTYRLERARPPSVDEAAGGHAASGTTGQIVAPMPGRIANIAVTAGQSVSLHQPLMVLEAMKMEHVVEAPRAGVVTALCVEIGQQVPGGIELLKLGATEPGG